MKKGFTLVELSIVLVIIGLLIGGILVAQSLVDSAKVQNQVEQLTDYEVAVRLFKDRYRGIPGDSDLFSGDGDGVLESAADVMSCTTGNWDGELPAFFQDLSAVGFGQTFDGSTNLGEGFPALVINENAGMVAVGSVTDRRIRLCMRIGNPAGLPGLDPADWPRTVRPYDAFSIDVKADDGNSASGNFTASSEVGGACASSGVYNIDNPENACRPTYIIDPNG